MNWYVVKDSMRDNSNFATDNRLWLLRDAPMDLDSAIKEARNLRKKNPAMRVNVVRVDV